MHLDIWNCFVSLNAEFIYWDSLQIGPSHLVGANISSPCIALLSKSTEMPRSCCVVHYKTRQKAQNWVLMLSRITKRSPQEEQMDQRNKLPGAGSEKGKTDGSLRSTCLRVQQASCHSDSNTKPNCQFRWSFRIYAFTCICCILPVQSPAINPPKFDSSTLSLTFTVDTKPLNISDNLCSAKK